MKLQDKVVVITGAGGGIGAACARRFTAEGARVVLTDRDAAALHAVASEIGTVALAGDIGIEDHVRAVAELARRTYGEIDVWFSNAGISGPRQPGQLQDNDLWESFWQVHVMAHVYAARAVLPSMVERGEGYLIQTASAVSLSTQPDKVAYSVTKHGALALAEWLAVTYGRRGIKVSCFCPGAMLTPMLLANNFPEGHPILTTAATPERVADQLVGAIDAEQFLIVDSEQTLKSFRAKASDYDQWITNTEMVQ